MRRTVGPPRASAAGASPAGGPPSPPLADGPSGSTVLILAPAWGLRVNAVPRQLTESWAGTARPVGCTVHDTPRRTCRGRVISEQCVKLPALHPAKKPFQFGSRPDKGGAGLVP